MLKKIIVGLIFFIGLFLIVSTSQAAWDYGVGAIASGGGYKTTGDQSTLTGIIGLGLNVLLSALALIFLAIMFYAGLRWMTARGNEEYVQSAKNALYAGVIGFAIVVSSYGISYLIFDKLGKGVSEKKGYCVVTYKTGPVQSSCVQSTEEECKAKLTTETNALSTAFTKATDTKPSNCQ